MSDGEKVIRLMQTQEDCAALRRLLDAARAEGRAEGAAEEREANASLAEEMAAIGIMRSVEATHKAEYARLIAAAIRGRK